MKPTRPGAYARTLAAAIATSRAPNSPPWKSVASTGSASSASPVAAGHAITSTRRSAQSSVAEKCSAEEVAWCSASRGRITVPSATPNTPSGNSMSRSE